MTNALGYKQAAMQDSMQHNTYRHAGQVLQQGLAQERSCHTTALSGCNQPHKAYNPVGIHQMAPLKGDMQRYLTKLTESYFQLLTTIQRRLHNRF